jgi:hypothetical protein
MEDKVQDIFNKLVDTVKTVDFATITILVAKGAELVELYYGNQPGNEKKQILTGILINLIELKTPETEEGQNIKNMLIAVIPSAIDIIVAASKGKFAINDILASGFCCK